MVYILLYYIIVNLFAQQRSKCLIFPFEVQVFTNHFRWDDDPKADLAAIRIASVNPILDPWIYILLRRSLFRRLLALSRRGSGTRSNSTRQRNIYMYPEVMTDSHVFGQLMFNTHVITQLPATAKFTPHDTENLCET